MSERTKMIVENCEGGFSLAALARRYGVNRKTAYKWVERFKQEQWAGLQERSRALHHQSNIVSAEVEARILALKTRWHLWGSCITSYANGLALRAVRVSTVSKFYVGMA